MLAPEPHAALIGWEPVNSRIITAKFTIKKKDIRLNIIPCYAPTNDAEEEKKDDFYQQLQAVLDGRGAKDITILMGDFNAKIGVENTGIEDIMGTHRLGQMNENGERFADLCALNQLVIVCLFVCWLLNVPATCECISGTDLHRQFYVLPH